MKNTFTPSQQYPRTHYGTQSPETYLLNKYVTPGHRIVDTCVTSLFHPPWNIYSDKASAIDGKTFNKISFELLEVFLLGKFSSFELYER